MESVLPACVCGSHAVEPEVAITAAGICPGATHEGRGQEEAVKSSGSKSTKCQGVFGSFSDGHRSVLILLTLPAATPEGCVKLSICSSN